MTFINAEPSTRRGQTSRLRLAPSRIIPAHLGQNRADAGHRSLSGLCAVDPRNQSNPRLFFFLALALLLSVAMAAQTAPGRKAVPKPATGEGVELAAEPNHKLALENEQVRVFKVELPPGKSTALLRHQHDFLLVALSEGRVEITPERGKGQNLRMAPGELQLGNAGLVNRVANTGTAPLHYALIEVLAGIEARDAICGTGRGACEADFGDITGPRATTATLFETPTVRVRQTEMEPQAALELHQHKYSHLVIATSDFDLSNEVEEKEPAEIHPKAGDVAWVPAGLRHALKNTGRGTARFLTVEFK
jgi:quercetin dioxygenase-like cupin family protein